VLVALVYERLQETSGLAVSCLRVLRCLAGHLNMADNYVWPSLPCVAEETGLSETQAGRSLRALAAVGAVRVVTDAAEIAAIERKRPGRRALPGNTYDLSPLLRWVPAGLVRAVAAPAPRVPSPPVASAPPAPFCLSSDNKEAERETGWPVVSRPSPFHTPKKASETEVPVPPSPALIALRGAGVSGAVAGQIIADKGEAWALRLVAYGRAQKEAKGAGWLVQVWKGFEGWPDSDVEKVNREAARSARIVRAPRQARVSVTSVAALKAERGPVPGVAAVYGASEGLPEPVLALALAAVVATLPAGLRRVVEARGVGHRLVQAAAHRMMKDALPEQKERVVSEVGDDDGLGNDGPSGGVGRPRTAGPGTSGGTGGGAAGAGRCERAAGTTGGTGLCDHGGGGSRGGTGTRGDGRAP